MHSTKAPTCSCYCLLSDDVLTPLPSSDAARLAPEVMV